MKSPLKYPKWPTILCFFIGCVIFGSILNSARLSGAPVTSSQITYTIIAILLNTLTGWLISLRFLSAYLHRKVKSPVKPHKLVAEQTYYLNGQTKAVFIGALDYPKKCLLFHIEGLNKKKDRLDAKALTSDEVMTYISEIKEI